MASSWERSRDSSPDDAGAPSFPDGVLTPRRRGTRGLASRFQAGVQVSDGVALAPFHVPWMPKDVLAPGARAPL